MKPLIEVIEQRLFAGAVADEIVALVEEQVEEKGRCSLVLSGGSTPGAIYRTLSMPPRVHQMPWEKVEFFWGDERWVPHDDVQSNCRMVHETLVQPIVNQKGIALHTHAVNTDTSTPEESASQYAGVVRKELDAHNVFDIVLLGLGEDGHTASLFPGSSTLDEREKLCVASQNPHDGTTRITLTPSALFSAKRVIFIVSGAQKADIVKRVLEGHEEPAVLPAKLWERATGKVTWFLDSASGAKLSAK